MSEQNYQPPSADITPNVSGTDEEQDLRSFIGPNSTQYYIDRFARIDEGRGGGWHWPAFFITSGWLLYRKMWLWAVAYIIGLPILATMLSGIVSAAINEALGGFLYLGYVAATFFVVPFFVNKLYYAKATSQIEKINAVGLEESRRQRFIEKTGGTSLVAAILIMIIPLTGIMAAISIPAYQDYAIRAQVSEGLALASPVKAAVTDFYRAEGEFPSGNADAGMPESGAISGNYVASIDIYGGEIVITYGNNANISLAGSTLSLVPLAQGDGVVVWECSGDFAYKWMPAACRN